MKENFLWFFLLALSGVSSTFNRLIPKNSALDSRINELNDKEHKIQKEIEAKQEELIINLIESKYSQERYNKKVSKEEYLNFQEKWQKNDRYNIQCQDPWAKFSAAQAANKIETEHINLVGAVREKIFGITAKKGYRKP